MYRSRARFTVYSLLICNVINVIVYLSLTGPRPCGDPRRGKIMTMVNSAKSDCTKRANTDSIVDHKYFKSQCHKLVEPNT